MNNIYYISIDDSDELGLSCISLVDNEAVQSKFINFADEQPKQLTFAMDKSHRTVSGIALRADFPIYRLTEDGEPYYVVFTPETIEKMVKRYAKNNLMNQVSLQHDGKLIDGIYLYESYLIDKKRGICPEEFQNIEDHSWIVSYYVEDDQLWDEIVNGDSLHGFSVECLVNLNKQKFEASSKEKTDKQFNNVDDIIDYLANDKK